MTAVLSAAIGITVGAAVLHATLGMRRPFDKAHLYFACMMVFLALNFYFGLDLYRATTVDGAVGALKRQVLAILGCHGCLLLLVPAYTRVGIPAGLLGLYWTGLILLFVANIWAPYGLLISAEPTLVRATIYGTPYAVLVAPPMGPLQYAYAIYFASFLVLALVCAVSVFRRGERQRAAAFGAAIVLILATSVVDMIRDSTAASWPYVGELGFVAWAIIMSVQLAHDFRVQTRALRNGIARVEALAERLSSILEALRVFEREIQAPLARLEVDMAALHVTTSRDEDTLLRLRRATARLRNLARSMPDISAERIANAVAVVTPVSVSHR